MPNGNDRNWIRFCAAVDGFRSVFGRWPVRVRLFPDALADIRDHILSPEGFARVRSRVEFVSDDDAPMIAEDMVTCFDMDEAYFQDECLIDVVSEGLAAVSLKIHELINAFQSDIAAEWDRDAMPQLTELSRFVTSVMMGTNEVFYPGKHLKDFTWKASAE